MSTIEDFRTELQGLINRHSRENGCNTPDWILAEYLVDCLLIFDKAVTARERWYGRTPHMLAAPGPTDSVPKAIGVTVDNLNRHGEKG